MPNLYERDDTALYVVVTVVIAIIVIAAIAIIRGV